MATPAWFGQLKWSRAVNVAALNTNRSQIPDFTGCYAFTIGRVAVAPGRVLYIGEAAGQSLRSRLCNYLIDYRNLPAPTGKQHKGKAFILEARDNVGDQGVYVRWVEYGGSEEDIHILEASIIHYLNPGANDRMEENRHALLGDDERLDKRLIW